MIGTRGFSDAISGLGRNALDVPVAALAALAVAFAAFSIPADQLAELVATTGLPELLPAAQPPLGGTARIALGGAGAVGVFALVFGLLRLLGRKPAPRPVAGDQAPRVRRRDLHPDAPTRRPISATLEFGEPGSTNRADSSVPAWLAPAELGWEENAAESGFLADLDLAEPALEEPATGASAAYTQEIGETGSDDDLVEAPAVEFPHKPDDLVEAPIEHFSLEPDGLIDAPLNYSLEAEAQTPWPIFAPSRVGGSETIAQLMERLEQGLSRRQSASESLSRSALEATASAPVLRGPAEDDRLQSAIDSLQRLASRQG